MGWSGFFPLADLNGDGIPDLILINGPTQSGYVMLGDGHGSFTKSSSITGYGGVPQVMDINGDGKVDILFPGGSIWLGKGDGTDYSKTVKTVCLRSVAICPSWPKNRRSSSSSICDEGLS
jgi:hypothetical protein